MWKVGMAIRWNKVAIGNGMKHGKIGADYFNNTFRWRSAGSNSRRQLGWIANVPDPSKLAEYEMDDVKTIWRWWFRQTKLRERKNMFASLPLHFVSRDGGARVDQFTRILTQVGTWFLVSAICWGDHRAQQNSFSDQYINGVCYMMEQLVGRITHEKSNGLYHFSESARPQVTAKSWRRMWNQNKTPLCLFDVSGLINPMNEDELNDLLAYLMVGNPIIRFIKQGSFYTILQFNLNPTPW